MTFESIDALRSRYRILGASRMFFKILSENDNSKQQIYVGGSFEVLQVIPHGDVREEPGFGRPNYKAPLDFRWIDSQGRVARAEYAQLILYPKYPEVRLSGFLRGCDIAPSRLMAALPRRAGRVLFLGVSPKGTTYAYAASPDSAIALEAIRRETSQSDRKIASVFSEISLVDESPDSRRDLLQRLWQLHREGWVAGVRLDSEGRRHPCNSSNCGGYTLEAAFGVLPNGRSAPDYRGWELKAHTRGGRVTLMTPEPTLGFYRDQGAGAFVRKFGRRRSEGDFYFTGQHQVGSRNSTTRMTMRMVGYDPVSSPRGEVGGALHLCNTDGEVAAGWSFADLLALWSRKHANAAYVPYELRRGAIREYRYDRTVTLGTGASFEKFLAALFGGVIRYDPGPKVTMGRSGNWTVKPRSQFRVAFSGIRSLYEDVCEVLLPIDR